MSPSNFLILALSTNFCPTRIDLSGDTFYIFQKIIIFGTFNELYPLKM